MDDNLNNEAMNRATQKLQKLFEEVKMPESHGLAHCLTVLGHMKRTISAADNSVTLTPEKQLALKLAALLHEADDHKYFPSNANFDNARRICEESVPDAICLGKKEEIISDVVLMISLVSASVNGNSVPEAARKEPCLLWPRYCDRLEAIGVVGAVRCFQYNRERGEPLMVEATPRPRTAEEVWRCVTEARWRQYQAGGTSSSMMDHYYDKLLHVAKFDPATVNSSYLVAEARRRVQPLVDVCIESGISGEAPLESLRKLESSILQK